MSVQLVWQRGAAPGSLPWEVDFHSGGSPVSRAVEGPSRSLEGGQSSLEVFPAGRNALSGFTVKAHQWATIKDSTSNLTPAGPHSSLGVFRAGAPSSFPAEAPRRLDCPPRRPHTLPRPGGSWKMRNKSINPNYFYQRLYKTSIIPNTFSQGCTILTFPGNRAT